jgi:hypothetical protein
LPASGDGEEAAGAAGRLHVQRSTISLFVWLVADGWWLVLICCERKVLLAGCWWLVCSERKVLLAGG